MGNETQIIEAVNFFGNSLWAGVGTIGGTVGGFIVAWLFKNWIGTRLKNAIKTEYQKEMEAYKAELKRDNDVHMAKLNAQHEKAMQSLKHHFEIAKLEREIRLSGNYKEIVEVVKELHSYLLDIYDAVSSYTSIWRAGNEEERESEREKQRGKIKQLIPEFWSIYKKKHIFITHELDEKIITYITTVQGNALQFMELIERDGDEGLNRSEWYAIDKKVRSLWDTVLMEIQAEFREILGIEPRDSEHVQ